MITRLLIILNGLGFIWEIWIGGTGILSGLGSDASISRVFIAGALYPVLVLQYGQWWRIITGAFLHGGLIHIGVNMMSLWFLGRFIEFAVGSWRMFFIYMASLIVSGLAVVYLSPPMVPTVGASGAIFGLFGALFAIGFKLGRRGMELVKSNIGILVINLVITFTVPQISWQAHVAGLLTGFILTFAIYAPPRPIVYQQPLQ